MLLLFSCCFFSSFFFPQWREWRSCCWSFNTNHLRKISQTYQSYYTNGRCDCVHIFSWNSSRFEQNTIWRRCIWCNSCCMNLNKFSCFISVFFYLCVVLLFTLLYVLYRYWIIQIWLLYHPSQWRYVISRAVGFFFDNIVWNRRHCCSNYFSKFFSISKF